MPETRTITFRDQTTGRINDLLLDEGQPCAQSQNLLGYLAGALLSYRDEGVEFTPSIIVCNSTQGFLKAFPGAVSHTIGTAPLDPSSGPKILKDCAPLSSRNWFIFIERTGNGQLSYGVFTFFRLPTAISLADGITIDPQQFCILIRKVSVNTIEMRGAKGSILTLIFSTTRESIKSDTSIANFAQACCKNLDDRISKEFRRYFARLLDTALTNSHGAILACGDKFNLATVKEMSDAVSVSPMLDFQAAFLEYQTANTADSILNLQRCEELLYGFLRCDGIVMFDTFSRVTAYRVFYRPTEQAADSSPTVVGGARRRAFEGLKALAGC